MSKRMAGKRWFEALGRSHAKYARLSRITQHEQRDWPQWARVAYARGVLFQTWRRA